MFGRRRSFKVAPGIKVNTGKRGVTSVNVAGVKLGTGSRRNSSGGRKPTRAEQLAKYWRMKPGLWYVRFDTGNNDHLDLEVRGSELTFDRFMKMSDAASERNGTTEARIFRQFVASWDMVDETGKVEPISSATLEKVSNGFFYGLTIEIVNALKIPNKSFDSVLLNANTKKPYPIKISDKPFSGPPLRVNKTQESGGQHVSDKRSSQAMNPANVREKTSMSWIRKFFTGIIVAILFLVILAALL